MPYRISFTQIVIPLFLSCFAVTLHCAMADENEGLRLAVFDIDVTPPIGYQMAYDPVVAHWELGLQARGIVLLGAGKPIALCAFDWIGISNEAHDAFRDAIARAAGTTRERIAVHCLHQHDAPACDYTTEKILQDHDLGLSRHDGDFPRDVLVRLEEAVASALPKAQPVTHLGVGEAEVFEVASNRRILGPDGKVSDMRFTACGDPKLRAEPEGVIDPMVSVISLWNEEKPLAVLSYYACHPQSYYRTGIPNPDFPGVARFFRQLAVPSALHVHFNGPGGNIGAGKYNDGSPENRLVLAERLADGMRRAWDSTEKTPIGPGDVNWGVVPVALPLPEYLSLERFENELTQGGDPTTFLSGNASKLAWLRRCAEGHKIDITCLSLGNARILNMPGELFVEYQLAAKKEAPDLFVAMAAYGDYAPGYIGTAVAYEEGGYETSERASNVSPEAEAVLMTAIKQLLHP